MKSIWQENCSIPARPMLDHDIKVKVAIIGAGLSGLLIAEKLREKGIHAVIFEADRIGSGQSGKSTAKITSQHNLIYQKLIDSFGLEKAKQYAMMNQQAITDYEKLIKEQNIECDFKRIDTTLFTSINQAAIQKELESARLCGLDPQYDENLNLPFETKCGITFKNQAQFNPMQFLKELSKSHTIYEKTKILKVEDHTLLCENYSIQADKIIFACHFPFINFPGYYFARMHQSRSNCLLLNHVPELHGCFLSIDEDGLSFRDSQYGLIMGGMSYKCGENTTGGKYQGLITIAKKIFPNCVLSQKWSAQDCMTLDQVPYIGQFSANKPDWYVATGYNKWGMTSSMVAANIISNMIVNHDKNETIFNPSRFNTASIGTLTQNSMTAIKGLALENLTLPQDTIDDLPINHGGIIEVDGKSYGVYKDENEKVFIVSSRCPHLGCQLTWNPDEKTWDCPCHGSRFSYSGKLIDGPAQTSIQLSHDHDS